ncbi:MAG: BsaWI family type II restriction enzyme [Thermodesulfobacteriota bacterium]
MTDQEIEKEIKEKIYGLKELKGINIAKILLPIYKRETDGFLIEKRIEKISTIWGFVEKIFNTTDKENMHPYLKQQVDPEQSKKGFLGNAWEQIFESLANEFLETLGVKVIRLSREKIENLVNEIGVDILEEKFKRFKELGLIEESRFSKGKIVDLFYTDIMNQLKVYIDDEYKVVVNPDCDLIIIKYINDGTYTGKMLVLAVLSSKKKFRERIAQVGYWTVKFRHSGSKVKNLLITPDEDKDFLKDSDHKKIAEVDTDGTYVVSLEEIRSTKIKHLKFLREEVKKILDERNEEIAMYKKYGNIIAKLLRE